MIETEPRRRDIVLAGRRDAASFIEVVTRLPISRFLDMAFQRKLSGETLTSDELAIIDSDNRIFIFLAAVEAQVRVLLADPTKTDADYVPVDPEVANGPYTRPTFWDSTIFYLPSGGTTAQYIDGTGALHTFPTAVSTFSNDSGYITASALSGYLLSSTAASTYQPLDSDLTAIAALATTSYGRTLLIQADGAAVRSYIGAGTSSTSGTVTSVGLTGFTGITVTSSPVTGAGTIALATTISGLVKGNGSGFVAATSGTDYDAPGAAAAAQAASQPLDGDLTAIAALTTTTFGRSLLSQVDGPATRTTIGAGTSSFSGVFSALTGIPTTLSGYGITDAYPLTGNPSAFLTSITGAQVTTALGFTPYNATNPSSFIAVAGARTAISLTTTGTSGASAYNSTTGVLNVPQYANSGGTVTSVSTTQPAAGLAITGGPITGSGTLTFAFADDLAALEALSGTGLARRTGTSAWTLDSSTFLTANQTITVSGDVSGSGATSISLTLATVATPGTYTGVTVNAKGLVTSGTTLSFSNAPARSIVTTAAAANGWQLSASQNAFVTYSVTVTCAVQIGVVTNVEGYVVLERSATNSVTASDWKECGRVVNGQNIGLAIALSQTQKAGGPLFCGVPAGYYVRLRSVNTAGTPTYAYIGGDEVLM